MNLCSADECKATPTRRDYCDRHYRAARRRGEVGWNGTACSNADCELPAISRGLCAEHYKKVLSSEKGPCLIEGCEQSAWARGWCKLHYGRYKRNGDPLLLKRRARQTCSADRCDRDVVTHGLCQMHWRRLKRYGSTELPAKPVTVEPELFTCKQCGTSLEKLKAGRRTYCSDSCKEAWQYWDRKAKHRGKWLKQYGLTEADFDRMLEDQQGRCAICRSPDPAYRNWCVDHDHSSGAVRGLLCRDCNTGLGLFKDNTEFLRQAIAYLDRSTSAGRPVEALVAEAEEILRRHGDEVSGEVVTV